MVENPLMRWMWLAGWIVGRGGALVLAAPTRNPQAMAEPAVRRATFAGGDRAYREPEHGSDA